MTLDLNADLAAMGLAKKAAQSVYGVLLPFLVLKEMIVRNETTWMNTHVGLL